jgi:hypothetical protein
VLSYPDFIGTQSKTPKKVGIDPAANYVIPAVEKRRAGRRFRFIGESSNGLKDLDSIVRRNDPAEGRITQKFVYLIAGLIIGVQDRFLVDRNQ